MTVWSVSLVALAAFLVAPARAQSPFLPGDPQLAAQAALGSRPGTERWIVHFAGRPFTLDALRDEYQAGRDPAKVAALVADLERRMTAHQAPFVEKVEKLGGKVLQQWWLINACAIEIEPANLAKVRAIDNVAFLQPDAVQAPAAIKTATNASHHRADQLHSRGITGSGVAVAIADTGHDSNMNNTGRAHITYSERGDTTKTRLLFNKKIGSQPADDVNGHGTGVASCAAGWTWNTTTADQGHAFDAKIAGYAIADFTSGSTFTTTQASAWQEVAKDAAANNIRVANMSFAGSPDPLSAEQKAGDTLALVADVLVCTAAGNSGTNISNSQVNLNGLTVGAVAATTKALAGFSSRGFMAAGGNFPDLVANGVAVDMARRDNEAADYQDSGTSFASPMVAGAATLIRAANPSLNANETKAILLASTEMSPGSGANLVSGVGCGYLRDDVAHEIATNPHRYGRGKVSTSAPVCSWPIRVKQNDIVQVAIAWHRMDVSKSDFSDLQLLLKRGNTTLVTAASGPNSEEFVRFTATATEVLTVEVQAFAVRHVTEQEFAWAINVDGGAKVFNQAFSGPSYASAVSGAGDFNNDGYADFAIGHPGATVGTGINAGAVHVVSGKDHSSLSGGGLGGNPGMRLGSSLSAGDLNLDGHSEVVIGAPGGVGAIIVVDNKTQQGSFFKSGSTAGLGERVTVVPYCDADGVPDIVATDNQGVELVAFSGRTRAQLWRVTPVAGLRIHALDTVGDIDRDGLDDVILGLPGFSSGLGRMEIRSGKDGALLRSRNGQLVEGLGFSVAGVGDIDQDGVNDYMFGSPEHSGAGPKRGNCAVQSGRTAAFLHILFGSFDNQGLGHQVAGAGGDVDGDGRLDFLVASVPAGVVRVHSGADARVIQTINGPSTTFGAAIAGLSTSGDDRPDFLIGEPGFGRASFYDLPAVPNPPAFFEYGATCLGSASGLPRCGFAGPPARIGRIFTITLSSAPKSSIAVYRLGAVRTNLDLSVIGLTGCFDLVQSLITLSAPTDASGQGSLPLPVPLANGLVGATVHVQWLCVDLGKKPLPFALSTGGTVRLGAHR